ncbi:MarR family transcriptional regulator [Lactobacillus curvatus]|nr:MarR family transcriptional regulator [Latilactobacillus curvatus]MSE24211.1 MarR family transcriptional regulator [Latilactobacillus curvatus]
MTNKTCYSRLYGEFQLIARQFNLIADEYDISFEQYLILEVLEDQSLTPSQMKKIFKTSMPAVSRKINLLQEKNYIRKIRGLQDQRLVKVEITTAGKMIYSQITKKLDNKYNNLDEQHRKFISAFQ